MTNAIIDKDAAVKNLYDCCYRSKQRKNILLKLRKKRHYKDVAKLLNIKNANNCLVDIKKLEAFNLVSQIGKSSGIYEMIPILKRININAEMKRYHSKISLKTEQQIRTVFKKVPLKARIRRLFTFRGKYPEIFYDKLEDEINIAHSNPKLPNATLILCRKLIENLVYNLLEYKFQKKKDVKIYFDISRRRPHDFSLLLDNLRSHKLNFQLDEQVLIEDFLKLAEPFRRDANIKTHKVTEYLTTMNEVKIF